MLVAGIAAVAYAAPVHADKIHDAVKARNVAAVKKLLSQDASRASDTIENDVTPLHLASSLNATDIMKLLLDAGADVDATTENGATPLHWAASRGCEEAVTLLVDNGADFKAEAAAGVTALDAAAALGHNRIALKLATIKGWPRVEPASDPRFRAARRMLRSGDPHTAYDMLSALFRERPGNKQINFELGIAAYHSERYSHASLAFERVLAIDPADDPARLELARTYFTRDQFDLARQEFQQVIEHEPSDEVREGIAAYLSEMKRREEKGRPILGVRVSLGVFYDSNVNVGPKSDVIDIAPIVSGATEIDSLTVSEGSMPVESLGLFLSVAAAGARDTGVKGHWTVVYGGSAYASLLEGDAKDQEILFGNVTAGMQYGEKGWLVRAPAKVEHITQGGNPLVSIFGVAPAAYIFWGGAYDWRLVSSAGIDYRLYSSEFSERDGVYLSLGSELSRYFKKKTRRVSLGAKFFYDGADEGIYKSTGGELSAGADVMFGANTVGYMRLKYRIAGYSEQEALSPEKRRDDQFHVILGGRKQLADKWGINANCQYTQNQCTFGLYEYERFMVTVDTSYTF